jgi:uncharacterized protein (DUF58 family)
MNEDYRKYLLEGEQAGLRYQLGLSRKHRPGRIGLHQGIQAGSSLEFKEHRLYEPGDDLRHVDWNAYARSDQLTVKQFHQEISPHLDLVLDGSRSMDLADSAKARACLGMAALLATAAANAGFSQRVWLVRERSEPVGNGENRAATWEGIDFNFGGDTSITFLQQPPAWRPRSVRFLLTDLLWSQEPLHLLAAFAENASTAVVVQILAQADAQPEARGHVRLVDSETGRRRELRLDDWSVQRYRDTLARHQQNWHLACRQVGVQLTTVIAETFVETWRLDELIAAEIVTIA